MVSFADDLCTQQIFTTELIEGIPVDKCVDMDAKTRNHISMLIQNLVLKEMFVFRYMQTDPNWSNFFYNAETKQVCLKYLGQEATLPHFLKFFKTDSDFFSKIDFLDFYV